MHLSPANQRHTPFRYKLTLRKCPLLLYTIDCEMFCTGVRVSPWRDYQPETNLGPLFEGTGFPMRVYDRIQHRSSSNGKSSGPFRPDMARMLPSIWSSTPWLFLSHLMTISGLKENFNWQLTIFQVRQWRWQPKVECLQHREPFSKAEWKEKLIIFVCSSPISCSGNETELSQHAYCPLATSIKYARVKLCQWRNWRSFIELAYSLLLPYLYDLLGTVFLARLQ